MMKLIMASLMCLILISCATVSETYKNPAEEAGTNREEYARVTFYNNTNLFLYPSSSPIGIEVIIDGMLAARPKRGQYLSLYIKKGRHDLTLTHWDVFKFTDNYTIDFTDDNYIVELYCGLVSTPYEIKRELPKDFNKDYENVTP